MARPFLERLRIELGKPDILAPLVVLGASPVLPPVR